MRLVFAGTPEAAVPALDALLALAATSVVAVVTRPDAPAGRGRTLVAVAGRRSGPSELGVEVLKPPTPARPGVPGALRELAPDCCPVVAYGALLPQRRARHPARTAGSTCTSRCCPPGAAPPRCSTRSVAGDEVTGATTFRIEEGLDTGPVFGMVTETVAPRRHRRRPARPAGDGGAGLLVATLDGIEDGSLEARPQPAEGVSLAPEADRRGRAGRLGRCRPHASTGRSAAAPRPRAPGRRSAASGSSSGRCGSPAGAPGADNRVDGRGPGGPTRVMPARDGLVLAPGELHVSKQAVLVGTASAPVELGEVRPHGKKPMAAADWARGVRITTGERLDG